jgi:GGDEF domain-containing protein
MRRPWHIALAVIMLLTTAYLIVWPPESFPVSLLVLIPIGACGSMLVSFFLAQSRRLSAEVILGEIRRLSKESHGQHHGVCSAIRFDIDRLKAIANHYPDVGERVRATVDEIISEEVERLRRAGFHVSSLDIAGEDETVVVAAGLSVEQAADFADEVRRRVKRAVREIPYYDRAVQLVVNGMQPPSTLEEEREGLGTVSAGVAADRGLAEVLFSDISAAVKESKTRGRNKTVIHRPNEQPEVRSDFDSQASKEQ